MKILFKKTITHSFFLIIHSPIDTKRQNPILGRNKILSAITKPTVKNKFDAGKKENVAIARDRDVNLEIAS